jgi:uncharacterized protein YutD
MKKGIKESAVQRMRNIVSGKHTSKTKIQGGYRTYSKTYGEGDVWKERGKTWTIKNGIKQNVTKMDTVRNMIKIPVVCPVTKKPMKHKFDKVCYRLYGYGFEAYVQNELKLKLNGTWKKHVNEIRRNNRISQIRDLEVQYMEWLDSDVSKKFITENGIIEDWENNIDKESLKKDFYEQLDKFKQIIEE